MDTVGVPGNGVLDGIAAVGGQSDADRRPLGPFGVRATNSRFSIRVSWCETLLFEVPSGHAGDR